MPKIGGEKRSKKKFKFACDQRVEKSSWEEITFESSGGPFSRTRRNQSMRREGDEGNRVSEEVIALFKRATQWKESKLIILIPQVEDKFRAKFTWKEAF